MLPPEVPELVWGAPCGTSGRGAVWQARWATGDDPDEGSAGWPLRARRATASGRPGAGARAAGGP